MLDPFFLKMFIKPPVTFAGCCGAIHYSGWPETYSDYSLLYNPDGSYRSAPNYTAFNASSRDLTLDDCQEIMASVLKTTVADVERLAAIPDPVPGQIVHPLVKTTLHCAMAFAILNTHQRKIWHETFVEFGWVELGAAYNYANDCHLYLITVKRPMHMSLEDWQALPFTKAREQQNEAA